MLNIKVNDRIIRKSYGIFPEITYTVLNVEPAEFSFLGSVYTLVADDWTTLHLYTSELENNLELWEQRGGCDIIVKE